MSKDYVVIDLETTGLDIVQDEIIEIAAVKIRRGLQIDRFSTLVSCTQVLREEITLLTGITSDMLLGQPSIVEAISMLQEFVGDAQLIAHNADFDSSMLHRYWPDTRTWLDTIVLSQIVWPSLPSYSLANLSATLNIDNQQAHRALSDAMATADLFVQILKQLENLPLAAKKDILLLAAEDDSATGILIRQKCALDAVVPAPTQTVAKAYSKPPARVVDESYCLDTSSLAAYLGADSLYQERIEGFEERPQQLKMAQAVCEALNNNSTLLVEAGTGTGKSLAYLLPSALYGLGSGQQIAVSTHTRNLQEQLLNKDIPMLSRLLDKPILAVAIKGRSNYLCRRLYAYYLSNPPENMRYFLMRVAVWRASTRTGDGGEINVNSFDSWKWQRVCASKENCAPFCPFAKRNACVVQRIRAEAVRADVIILNHSLLIANAAMEGGFLPPLPNLIIDEAQHLEHAAEDQMSARVDIYEILNLLGRLSRREKGRVVGALAALEKHINGLGQSAQAKMVGSVFAQLQTDVEQVMQAAEQFFDIVSATFKPYVEKSSFFPLRVRIVAEHRQVGDWLLTTQLGNNLSCTLDALARNCFRLLDVLACDEQDNAENLDIARPAGSEELFGTGSLARELAATLRTCMEEDNVNYVSWVEFPDTSKKPSINVAPIDIGQLLHDCLYLHTNSLIMTSATLSVERSFDYFKGRLGLNLLPDKPTEMVLSSPFFYREQAMFAIINDLPDWSRCKEEDAIAAISQSLIHLLTASQGRAIVLFTSHYQLKSVYQQIREPLRREGITLLAHGVSGAPSSLLERLKQEEKCCILGAASFWEGVDVIGEALSLIVVVRLPFWPPNTPIAAARMERIEQAGGSAFRDYSLPQALIRFKQGFGRLIRSDKDNGVFCVLDKRIIEKYYGKSFIRSLPDMSRYVGSSEEIANRILSWLR